MTYPIGPVAVSGPIADTGKTPSFEAGLLAQQADGAVVSRIGNTIVLSTA